MSGEATAKGSRWRPRLLIALAVTAAVLLVAGANAHLVHVATNSQPACVPHLKTMDEAEDTFRAAKSAC